MENNTSQLTNSEISCSNCGAKLIFKPGTTSLVCEFCGTENSIQIDLSQQTEAHREIPFMEFLSNKQELSTEYTIQTVACAACGSNTSVNPNVVVDSCSFCGTPFENVQANEVRLIKPQGMLPFNIDAKEGHERFANWINKLWWAPNDLKKYARINEKLQGVYIPYWTYDSDTSTNYSGARGEHYYETETYRDSDGKTQTRQVQKTRWYNVSGRVNRFFDDMLVMASESLPQKYADKLEPWDLNNMIGYDPKFMSGFRSEAYQIDMEKGFEVAKDKMKGVIEQDIRMDIGGDEQRIYTMNTTHSKVTFKHILLPIWISAYRYRDKLYRFMINGRNGKVSGERPYSWIKITLAILAGLAVAGGIYYFSQMQ
jgi:DNA-directed RNA polymerase subunit RPC12/RpoP